LSKKINNHPSTLAWIAISTDDRM